MHIIQTSTGQHLITSAANAQAVTSSLSGTTYSSKIVPISSVSLAGKSRLLQLLMYALVIFVAFYPMSVLSGSTVGRTVAATSVTVDPSTGKPVLRVAPMASSSSASVTSTVQSSNSTVKVTATPSTSLSVVSKAVINGTAPVSSSQAASTQSKPTTSQIIRPKSTSVLMGPASRKRALETETRKKFETELKLVSPHH